MSILAAIGFLFQSSTQDGFSIGDMVAYFPHDPASIFTLVLITVCVGLVLWSGYRTRGGKDDG